MARKGFGASLGSSAGSKLPFQVAPTDSSRERQTGNNHSDAGFCAADVPSTTDENGGRHPAASPTLVPIRPAANDGYSRHGGTALLHKVER